MLRRAILAILCAFVFMPARAQGGRDQALIVAAGKGDLAAVERLIREGASVAARDSRGRTALLAATHGNHVAAARALIAARADVNAKDDIEDTPFLYAGAEGRIEVLKMTLPTADLKSTNRYGGTALIPAAHHGHVEAVRILLGTAIDKDHVNNLGWTALLEAAILGNGGPVHTEVVRLLAEAGANVNIADREGVTPLAHAKRRGFREMIRILESRSVR
jgi:ankyrin repeat protein